MTSSMRLRLAALTGAAVLSVAALTGCGSSSGTDTSGAGATTTANDASTATVTEANGATESASIYRPDSGTVINETLGAIFAVELSQSPSTGYEWKQTGGTAASLIELIDEDVETEGDAPGSPGAHIFAYRASGEGSGTLVFEEFAPGKDTASDTVTFEVSVGAP
ncbi:MAG: protease inhibitor I42 family protein [Actinomycetota bacterium]